MIPKHLTWHNLNTYFRILLYYHHITLYQYITLLHTESVKCIEWNRYALFTKPIFVEQLEIDVMQKVHALKHLLFKGLIDVCCY